MKWCIEVTDDNYKILHAWRIRQPNVDRQYETKRWLTSEARHDNSYMSYDTFRSPIGYERISLEKFKELNGISGGKDPEYNIY